MNSILAFVAEVSASAGVIWAAPMALKRTLRHHLSPWAHLAVWLVLIVRLVLPVTLETGIHLAWIPVVPKSAAVPAETKATESESARRGS